MSLIYTVGGSALVATKGVIPLGTIIRKLGCAYDLKGDGIVCKGGFAIVDATVTLSPVETSTPSLNSVTLMQDGEPVQGATASMQSASAVTLPISAVIRNDCCKPSTLTLVNDGSACNVSSVSLRVREA